MYGGMHVFMLNQFTMVGDNAIRVLQLLYDHRTL